MNSKILMVCLVALLSSCAPSNGISPFVVSSETIVIEQCSLNRSITGFVRVCENQKKTTINTVEEVDPSTLPPAPVQPESSMSLKPS